MFVSLNSWTQPGAILQAETSEAPEEILCGGPDDWPRLRAALALRRQQSRHNASDSLHPRGAAIGYVTYEGEFRFGFFPEIQVVPEHGFSARWEQRKAAWPKPAAGNFAPSWTSNQTRAEFEAGVARAQEYIAAGDVYQVNLAQKFSTAFVGNPYRLFEHLMGRSPAPGGAFLDLGDGRQILSASPELFMRIQGRQIMTRPIKGTRPRHRDPVQDEQNAFELLTDAKELAELIMITDLERNDLGAICDYGTVAVTQLVHLERYAQVFHLVSTVEGQLRADMDAVEAVRRCLPGGSISGAPKKRASEIIRELEPCSRGIYTGVIGYFDYNGDAMFSIAIRTMIQEASQLHFSVGSGITAGSVPAREYEETLHKAAGMRLAVEAYRAEQLEFSPPLRLV